MNKKYLILIVLFFTTGCWNYNELNSLAIVTSMAIDKNDEQYEVSILIANSQNKQTSPEDNSSQTVVYSATGKTLSEALKNIDLKNPRQTYVGHLSSIIISEDVASDGLIDVLDLLFRNSESTKRFYIAIARKNKAKDILKIVSPLEAFPAQTISTNIKTSSESQAVSVAIIYSDFINSIISKGTEAILPSIMVDGDVKDGSKNSNLNQSNPKANLKLSTIAIFDKDKLVAFANKNQSRGINLALNKIESMIIEYKCKNNYLVSEINNINSKINVNIKDEVKVNIDIKTSGDITENTCDIDLNDNKEISKIEKNVEKKIKKIVLDGVLFAKEDVKLDVFGIGNIVYKKNPKFFNKINNWNEYFKELDISVQVKTNIKTKGSSKQSIKEAVNGN